MPVEVSTESCPLHLGTVSCMCASITWTESVGSGEKMSARVGQIIQKFMNYWKKRLLKIVVWTLVHLCVLFLSKCSWCKWLVTWILINQRDNSVVLLDLLEQYQHFCEIILPWHLLLLYKMELDTTCGPGLAWWEMRGILSVPVPLFKGDTARPFLQQGLVRVGRAVLERLCGCCAWPCCVCRASNGNSPCLLGELPGIARRSAAVHPSILPSSPPVAPAQPFPARWFEQN